MIRSLASICLVALLAFGVFGIARAGAITTTTSTTCSTILGSCTTTTYYLEQQSDGSYEIVGYSMVTFDYAMPADNPLDP